MTDPSAVIDLLALAACGLWAWRGWRRGALSTGLGLAGLVGGYAAALLFHRPVGALLGGVVPAPPLAILALAVLVPFVAAYGAVRGAGVLLLRRRGEGKGASAPPALDRAAGAALGAATAGAVILVLAWAGETAASLIRDGEGDAAVRLARGPGEPPTVPAGTAGPASPGATAAAEDGPVGGAEGSSRDGEPADDEASGGPVAPPGDPVRRSVAGRLGTAAAERTVEAAVRLAGGDGRAAAATAAVVARPADARAAARTLAGRDLARNLVADDALRASFYDGDAGAIAGHPGVRRLLEDREVREALRTLRVVDLDAATPEAMARQLADALAPVGASMEALRGDPEFVAALERSRLRERVRSGDVAGLAGDPDVVWMMGRVRAVLAGRR